MFLIQEEEEEEEEEMQKWSGNIKNKLFDMTTTQLLAQKKFHAAKENISTFSQSCILIVGMFPFRLLGLVLWHIYIYPTPPLGRDMTQRQFLSRV